MIRWENDKHLWKFGLPRCQHPTTIVAIVTTEGGRRSAREQCQICGKVDAPLRMSDYPDAPAANADALANWKQAFKTAIDAALANAQKMYAIRQAEAEQENAEWWTAYQVYLQSAEWKARRLYVLRRDGYVCQAALPGCTHRATEAHHKRYDLHRLLGHQPAYDIVGLCHACHEQISQANRELRKK